MTRGILLINPPKIDGVAFTREGRCEEREEVLGTVKPPLSLAIIASMLREKAFLFKLLDATALDLSAIQTINLLEEEAFQPSMIVFCTTTPTIEADTSMMKCIKEHFGSVLIAFGPHTSAVPIESMEKFPDLDAVIIGEPEETVLQIAMQKGNRLENVKGLCYRKNGHPICNTERRGVQNLDTLPYPAWDLLPLEKYCMPLTGDRYVLVEVNRGCPFKCDFCVVPITHGNKFRERDPIRVVDEIEFLIRHYKLSTFYLWGDTVTLDKRFMEAFCDEIIKRAILIRWISNSRAETINNQAFARKLKESGCWMLAMGVESSSDDIRERMQKCLQTQQIKQAFSLLRQVGIKSLAFFIFGHLGDTEASMQATSQFATSLDPDYASFYPAVPFPGTTLYEECLANGLLTSQDWSKYEYSHYVIKTQYLNEHNVMQARSKAYRRFYFRPKFLFRQLKEIKSLHAFAFTIARGIRFIQWTMLK
ncbi:MAG: radical SAM protein [Candidatus Poribacteria bacterium]|nr:radical SAM protein [Candidatus Poribacteria bacterium]